MAKTRRELIAFNLVDSTTRAVDPRLPKLAHAAYAIMETQRKVVAAEAQR
ncbi:MAG TPA: hypothetical protein VF597_00380 [Candidatus Saccharimonadales bacterium]